MKHTLSFWERDTFFAPKDFVIAGSGLVGLWTAIELRQAFPHATVLVLEKGTIPTGASTRNAGFACFGSPTEMMYDARTMGEDTMWNVVQMRFQGIEKIRRVLGDAAIGFDACGGYECYTKDKHNLDEIGGQMQWLNAGLKDITGQSDTFAWATDQSAAFGLAGFDAMIGNRLEGGLHSGMLVQRLLALARSLGVEVLTGIAVEAWQSIGDKVIVQTNHGEVTAGNCILAANAFTPSLHTANVQPGRGQVLITQPIEGLSLRGTFHFDEGFYYFRNVGNRVLLGGGRNLDFAGEQTTDMQTTAIIQQALEAFLRKHILPETTYTVETRWSGIMSFTHNKQPLIEQAAANVFCMLGCNGMGVALSPVMAEKMVAYFA